MTITTEPQLPAWLHPDMAPPAEVESAARQVAAKLLRLVPEIAAANEQFGAYEERLTDLPDDGFNVIMQISRWTAVHEAGQIVKDAIEGRPDQLDVVRESAASLLANLDAEEVER